MNPPKLTPETLDALQRETFDYFVHEVNPANGLVADKTQEGGPASIAAVGLALAAYPVGAGVLLGGLLLWKRGGRFRRSHHPATLPDRATGTRALSAPLLP